MNFKLALVAAFTMALHAAPLCTPDLVNDGVPVPQSCYGQNLIATPNSNWAIGFNDNLGGGDWDGNEPVFTASFNATGTRVTYQLIGAITDNPAWVIRQVIGGFIFDAGSAYGSTVTKLTLPNQIVLLSGEAMGFTYLSGSGILNPDGLPHFNIQAQTPEPSTWIMGLAGLIFMATARRCWPRT